MRRCPQCGEHKPLTDFYPDRSKASGHRSMCKRCDNAGSTRRKRAQRSKENR